MGGVDVSMTRRADSRRNGRYYGRYEVRDDFDERGS